LDGSTGGLGGFFARMTEGGLQGILSAYKRSAAEENWVERADRKIDAVSRAEAIGEDEAAGLAERFGREGRLHENEKALLASSATKRRAFPRRCSRSSTRPPRARISTPESAR
jgi:hypothetical protein